MAWTTASTTVTSTTTGQLIYTAPASAVTVVLRTSASVRIGNSPVAMNLPFDAGETLTLSLAAADEIYAQVRNRPGVNPPAPLSATVYVAAGP